MQKLLQILVVALFLSGTVLSVQAKPKKILVVTVTMGFHHTSTTEAEKVLKALGEKTGDWTVDIVKSGPQPRDKAAQPAWVEKITKDLGDTMNAQALKGYDAVIFANTTLDLPLPDKQAFLDWVKSGKAFIGMHSATDTFHSKGNTIDPYIDMIGAEFLTHGAQAKVECLNMDQDHPATRHIGKSYIVHDEIYIMKNFFREKVHGLLTLDKHPNKGVPGDYPIAWCKNYGKGRVFYTSLGHREDVWNAPTYQDHIIGGIRWALGLQKGDGRPQSTRLVLSKDEAKEGFKPLFNGTDLTGWKFRNADGLKSWSAQNGMLVNEIPDGKHGTDLVTEEKYWNFTVRFEYMIPKKSNSGFYLRGRHEIQIFDDYESGKASLGGNGAIYQHTLPAKFVSLPAGQWQDVEATMIGDRVTVILNGQKIHDNVRVERATGSELDRNVNEPGSFFLQGDHGAIAFRNMRVKILK